MPTCADLLRRYRRSAVLTQEELAERASLSVGAISAIERGLCLVPHRDTIALLADALRLAAPARAQMDEAVRHARAARFTRRVRAGEEAS